MRTSSTFRNPYFGIAIAAAMTMCQGPARAQPPAEPVEIAAIVTAADSGRAADQSRLGWIFFEGKGLPPDTQLAFHWFLKAAEQGDAEGLRGLQSVYLTGEELTDGAQRGRDLLANRSRKSPSRPDSEVEKAADRRKAQDDAAAMFANYTKAAASGDPIAQTALGVLYFDGTIVKRDYRIAMSQFRQAAEQGHADAQFRLGQMFADGLVDRVDAYQAVRWYRLAVAQGHAEAEYCLSLHTRCGCGTEKDDKRAFELMESSAARGNVKAQIDVNKMLTEGFGVRANKVEGLKWLTRAAKQGSMEGQFHVAVLNFSGDGVPQNKPEGIKWFTITAAHGHPLAQFCLGRMYREGDGVPVDLAMAAGYYRQAAVQSDAKAQYELARMLLAGEGVQPDALQSFAWFSIASDGGSTPAKEYVAALAEKLTAKELDAAKQLMPTLKASIKAPPADTPFLNQLR